MSHGSRPVSGENKARVTSSLRKPDPAIVAAIAAQHKAELNVGFARVPRSNSRKSVGKRATAVVAAAEAVCS